MKAFPFALLLLLAINPSLTRAAEGTKTSPSIHIKNVGVEEFAELTAAHTNVVLDVRTAREYAAGHIPGATNMDISAPDFEKKLTELDKSKTYLVHCAGGVRSARACKMMEKLSFTNLVNLEPGFKGWEKAGKPVEK